jgi:hypothetical protein
VTIAQLVFTYAPWMNQIFETEPLSAFSWGKIALVGIGVGLVLEIEKRIHHSWARRRQKKTVGSF